MVPHFIYFCASSLETAACAEIPEIEINIEAISNTLRKDFHPDDATKQIVSINYFPDIYAGFTRRLPHAIMISNQSHKNEIYLNGPGVIDEQSLGI